MKSSKLILLSMLTIFLTLTSSYASSVVTKQISKNQQFNSGLEISGAAFHDPDGNGIVDGTKISELDGEALYVLLVNKEEEIVASKALTKEGTFSFNNNDGLQPYNNYALIISTEKSVLRSVLPARWSYSGESISTLDTHKDNLKDGIVVVHVKDKNIAQIHFGLTVRPLAKEITQHIQLSPGIEAGVVSHPATVSMTFKELKLSGHVLNDGDGDNNVSGKAISAPDGKQLYALLLSTDQTVLASKAIEKEGTYSFDGKDAVKPDTEFFVILATSPDKKDFGLPAGWNNTGETINHTGRAKDTSPDGVIAVNVAKKDIENIDFGINKKPTADHKDIEAQLNLGLNGRVIVPTLTGNDRESGTELIYKIESLPTLGTLYYDGIKIEKINFIIEERNKLSLDPDDGDKVVLFTYATMDRTGVISDPARVEMIFKGLSVSGHLFNDGNGDTKVKGEALYNPSNTALYVTLLDENASVLASKVLRKDGSYSFNGEDGVRPNTSYRIVLSTKENAKTSLLPEEWANSGEVINAEGESKDLTVDGIVTVPVLEKDVLNVDFGIDKKPFADNKAVEAQVNPGGSQTVPVPPLSGRDEESGTDLRYMIRSLSENARLYDKKVKVSNLDFVDPNTLTLDPKDGKKTVTFSYVTVDHEGSQSKPATVTMSFTGLKISGTIFEDFIIDGNVDGVTTVAADKAEFYITLLNEKGEILATVPTLKDGSYLFDGASGVNAHTKYRLVLSKDKNATTSTLVEGWNHADGENINSLGKGNDGKADGMIDVSVKESDLKQVDFGINYLFQ